MSVVDATLARLNITLPPAPKPVAAYVPFVRTGNLVFISGQLPSREGKVVCSSKVPSVMPVEQAKEGARVATINALAVLRDACGGNLDQVQRIVRIGVFVQSDDGFDQQPAVANGASELLVSVFGEAGRHARAAVGVNALPLNAAVEVELLAELKN
jgi:enamine deaminase RidA (YjgF/YER057c/UK114 family)